MRKRALSWMALAAAIGVTATSASAEAPAGLQKRFEEQVRAATPGFNGFSAQRGERLFKDTHGADWSCATCHTQDPRAPGRHAKTGKTIAPLAPAANPERLTDASTVDKWFRRNCGDVLGRPCTAQEKGDVMQYLMSLK